jgi:hypothetical protein
MQVQAMIAPICSKNDILAWLERHGKQIGKECTAGDKDASAVIGQYQLIKNSPWNEHDPALWGFLHTTIETYCRTHGISVSRCV